MQRRVTRRIAWFSVIAVLSLWPIETSVGADASVIYRYDAAGRLIAAAYGSGLCVIYTYDINGNRLSETSGAPSTVGTGMWGCFSWNQANWGN
jgi:hypothetical protein